MDTKFLTRSYANAHSNKHFAFSRILIEAFSNKEELWRITLEQFSSELAFRKELRRGLGDTDNEILERAKSLRFYIKTRAPGLKFWSTLFTAFTALFGFTGALIALAFQAYAVSAPFLLAFLITTSAALGTLKYLIDKRLFWYDYVGEHLSAIIDEKAPGAA